MATTPQAPVRHGLPGEQGPDCSAGSPASRARCGGIERMVEQDRYCIDVLTQIAAIQAALDKVALGLLDGHARTCVIGRPSPGSATNEPPS